MIDKQRIPGVILIILLVITIVTAIAINISPVDTIPTTTSKCISTSVQYEHVPIDNSHINESDLDLLAAVIYYEAGSDDCTDRHQQLVAQVVLNRVASDEFPDTIYDVIMQTKPSIQYSPYKKIAKNAGNRDIIPQRCYDNALIVLNGEVECPSNIVWQANFKQGSGIYEVHKTSYSTTYFCYR